MISELNVCSSLNGNVDSMSFYGGEVSPTTYPATDLDNGNAALGPYNLNQQGTDHVFYMKIAATRDTGSTSSPGPSNASSSSSSSSSSPSSSTPSLAAASRQSSQSINLAIEFYRSGSFEQPPSGTLPTTPLAFTVSCGYDNVYILGIRLQSVGTFLVLFLGLLAVAAHHRSRRADRDRRRNLGRYARLGNAAADAADDGDGEAEEAIHCSQCRYV